MPWSKIVDTNYTEILLGHWDALIFLVAIPLIFILGKYLLTGYMWYHDRSFDMKKELVGADNKAVSVALVGIEAGLALTAWGALYDQDLKNYEKNIIGGFVWFFIGVFFMAVFFVFTDKITLKEANITEGTRKGNIAAALCVASNFVSSGIVALYTIGGGVDRWDEAIGSATLYFVLCRVFLSLSHYGIRYIFRRFGSLEDEVKQGNPAAGVLIFMMQTGISIFLTNPMRSSEEVLAFFVWCVVGALAIIVVDLLMWYVIVTRDGKQDFSEKRWGGVFVEGCGVIATSLAVIPFLPNTCAYTAQLTQTFWERLFSTETTNKLFQWPNLFYFVIIITYICGAKALYILPSLSGVPPRLWQYVLRFFLATPGDLPSLVKEGSLTMQESLRLGAVESSATFEENENKSNEAGALTSEVSLSSGKIRGLKNHLLKERSGMYDREGNEIGDQNIVVREGSTSAATPSAREDSSANFGESASKSKRGRKSAKSFAKVTDESAAIDVSGGGVANNGTVSRKTGNDLAEPLANEASIDFTAYAQHEGFARTAFETTTRISESRAVSFGGLLLSVGYLLRSSFATTIGSSYLTNYELVTYTLFWVGISTTTFLLGTVLQSFILWRHFSLPSRTNLASGIVLFGLLISVALQAGSSIMANQEDGPFDLSEDLPEALFVFVIQMILIGISGFIYQRFTLYDDQRAVMEGNTAAAVANAGFLIASSLLASAPTTKTSELASFALYFTIGSIFTHLGSFGITRKIIFGGVSTDTEILEDKNWGAAAVEAIVGIGMAYAYSALMPELCPSAGKAIVPSNNVTIAPNVTSNLW